jgi:hypothetical protein
MQLPISASPKWAHRSTQHAARMLAVGRAAAAPSNHGGPGAQGGEVVMESSNCLGWMGWRATAANAGEKAGMLTRRFASLRLTPVIRSDRSFAEAPRDPEYISR